MMGTSKAYWQRATFSWQRYKYCSEKCKAADDQVRRQALEREREALRFYRTFKPP
jgi:hypothetical protein